MSEIAFDPIEDLVADIKAGKMVIITDDENRENEGDLVLAAANVTPEAITFMATHARGLICAPLTAERAAEINLSTPASLSDPSGRPSRRASTPAREPRPEFRPSTGPGRSGP